MNLFIARWDNGLSIPKKPINGKDYPAGIGYYLGYWVVKDAIERRGLGINEFISHGMNSEYVEQQVYESLKYLSEQ